MSLTIDPLPLPNLSTERVPMALFRHHVGLPACAELDERLETLFNESRSWYARHGEPWTEARHVTIRRIIYDVIHLDHQLQLSSALLARGLARAEANALVVIAVSAGQAVDEQIDKLWKSDRVDEAMFLNAYAIATVEHLRWQVGDHLRRTFQAAGSTVLPHYSPGYDGWDLADQSRLYRLIRDNGEADDKPLRLLPSGGLCPSKSTLAAYGVTHKTDFDEDLDRYWSCQSAPTMKTRRNSGYAFPEKALVRWRDKRLKVIAGPNDELLARFHFDGSTCNNMGVPLAFEFEVRLKREADNTHLIVSSACEPAEDNAGYRSMCAYLDKPDQFMSQLGGHRPLVGQPLSKALQWQPPTSPAGCLCTRASQDHKWRIVLHTLHFALENHE